MAFKLQSVQCLLGNTRKQGKTEKKRKKMEIQFFSIENNSMLRSFGKKLVTV